MKRKQLHYNIPQIKSALIGAPTEVAIIARGGGKTEGIGAPKLADCYLNTMPRGTGVVVGQSYNQILTRTLPGLIYGWEKMGYRLGEHYLVGQKPSEAWKRKFKWEGPYRPPLKFDYFISWFNGGGFHLVSQDRIGSSNGITIDWIYGDEAKLLNVERLRQELYPANRGIIPAFKGNPYHHGITYTSDMPVGTSGWWLFDFEEMMDRDQIRKILDLQTLKFKVQTIKPKSLKARREKEYLIQAINEDLKEVRHKAVLYHTASALSNVHALGVDYILDQQRLQSEFLFDTQTLGLKPIRIEDGFYPDLDEDQHGYVSFDNSFLDSLGFDLDKITALDCRRDGDLLKGKALHITLDYNRRLWPLIVGQVYNNEIRTINSFDVEYPLKIKDVVDKFSDYYEPHDKKLIYYWFDHTAIGEQRESRLCDDVMHALRKRKWIVIPKYVGVASTHEARYVMWGKLLKETGEYPYRFRMNKENCADVFVSMFRAGAEKRKNGFGKDKSTEIDPNFPARESTHKSEALDTWVHGLLESKIKIVNSTGSAGIDSF